MKKTLLTLTFIFAVFFANAQCTPDPAFTEAGIYPDTSTGLDPAYVGQFYSQNITIITPTDTVVDTGIPGIGTVGVTIDSINLTSATGLPYGFDYSCDPPNCSFAGGSTACAELFSTINPHDSLIGSHNIIFTTTAYASDVPLLGTITQDDVIDYYYIDILLPSATINHFENTTFELKSVYPNPVMGQAKIQFVLGNSENIIFKVYNLLGEEMESQVISSFRGVNTIDLNTSSYSQGIYLYSITSGSKVLTKRMAVKN